MSVPYYVSPEQVLQDRADYARKGISRGKSLVAMTFKSGVLVVAENPSKSLHKVSEIYDKIAFAGVGKYNEYDQLRVAGVRHADTKGYTYSRSDVDARSLANVYANYLGSVFVHEMKPLEVEILVAEVGESPEDDAMFHILYDGTVMDEEKFSVLGGDADSIWEKMDQAWKQAMSIAEGVKVALKALSTSERELKAADLEVAVLERESTFRAFRRISHDELVKML